MRICVIIATEEKVMLELRKGLRRPSDFADGVFEELGGFAKGAW